MTTMEGGECRFDWSGLVPRVVHPIKVSIIEAVDWIGRPLSASDLEKVFDHQYNLSQVSYHLRTTAELGVFEQVGWRAVRGSLERFYFFQKPA